VPHPHQNPSTKALLRRKANLNRQDAKHQENGQD
jgi:hypothetical protein